MLSRLTSFKLHLIFLFLLTNFSLHAQSIEPPTAKKEPHITIIHGDTLRDDYFWLRKKGDYEVINYLSAENGYVQRMTKSGDWAREKLFQEIKSRVDLNDTSFPVKRDNYFYYRRYEADSDYEIYCRKKGSMSAEEEVLLDVNQLAKGMGYVSVRTTVSPDHHKLAYQVDYTGGGKTTVYIKDLVTAEVINDEVHRVADFTWFNDSETFAYTVRDTTNRSYLAKIHKVGNDVKNDRILFEEVDKSYSVSIGKTTSKEYFLLSTSVNGSSEYHFMPADDPAAELVKFSTRANERVYGLNHYKGDDHFYIYKNFPNKNYNISRVPVNKTEEQNWEEFYPANDTIPLSSYSMSDEFLVLHQKISGLDQFKVVDRKTNESYSIEFPDAAYVAGGSINLEYGPNIFIYSYSSLSNPGGIYQYDLRTKESKLLKESTVHNYNSDDYTTARIYAEAKDGTKVPISLVYKNDLNRNGNNPLLLKGYGSYGSTYSASFDYFDLSLLERGFVLAIAHVRGGGEYGFKWYDEGRLFNKMNTFTDFIAVTEHLINQRYTNANRLIIEGGSAGGLLMGAVLNMRPELYKGAIVNVPFVDVINTMLDETIPLTTFEYKEWGNPNKQEYYEYMKSYSPYDNIKAQDYPAMLVQGGYNDLNVAYWEPAKYVAKLRANKTDSNPLYLKTSMSAGHGLTSGRFNGMKQRAFEMAFMLNVLGMDTGYGTIRGVVKDHEGEPMPFVNVFVEGTTRGTTTNSSGEYALDLKNGDYNLIFSHVAYNNISEKVQVSGEIDLNVEMQSDAIMLKDIVVRENYTDPAYEIIKAAIDKRKDYLRAVDGFSADVYMKSFDRLDEIPDKLPAFLPKEDMPDSTDLGLVYLSESLSELYKKQPDEVKEVMISSKVGGWSQGYSWNQAGQIDFNFYQNRVEIGDLAARGIVSPVATNAMMFYQYEYLGEVEKQGSRVNKIKVIPRRRNDPVFAGNIYIAEDTWNVVGVDMILTNRQVEFYDTLYVEQDYVKVKEGLWMPLMLKTFSKIKIFGFAGSTNNIISYKNYEVNPEFPPRFFNNEIFKIDEDANKKDSVYWLENRPVVLTDEEIRYYSKSDSTERLRQSEHYLDSLDRRRNKLKINDILTGYNRINRHKKHYTYYSGLLEMFQFNTVEGLVVNMNWRFYKGDWMKLDKQNIFISANLRYGFSNERWNGSLMVRKILNPMKFQRLSFSGGRSIAQLNNSNPITPFINTSYSLLKRDNFMKIYGKDFGQVIYNQEVTNGIMLTSSLAYENREALTNTTDYSFVSNKEDRMYTSNNPLRPFDDTPQFDDHQALVLNLKAKISIKQKFATHPYRKIIYGSKYPTLTLNYRKGIKALGSDVNYDFASLTIGDNLDFGLLGKSSYDVTYGGFINNKSVPFIDYKHFRGNQTIFLNKQEHWGRDRAVLNAFHSLDYYAHSTNGSYLEAHYEHHFNGFLINKFPLLRRSKFQTLGGINFLKTGNFEHVEVVFGIENILKVMRVDFFTSYNDINDDAYGFRLWFGLGSL
ncbi:hypothetical protein E1176_10335 [Fulvivirga sp. RKSG066]|uniref:DUF5686 family protein n=1 Tax=Fulvivirga aurantia TaxID=2529383 RepID=UPI0012BC3EB4|nr:DUF5686 family protein [Fulvivirga aurantia]MTI21416.1 hypothetical protein [Fulvivirga aurantia]